MDRHYKISGITDNGIDGYNGLEVMVGEDGHLSIRDDGEYDADFIYIYPNRYQTS